MNNNNIFTEKDNPNLETSQEQNIGRPCEDNEKEEKSNWIILPKEEGDVDTEETFQTVFYDLNEYLYYYPIEFSENEQLGIQYRRLLQDLLMKDCNSILIIGEKGSGKTSLVYYLVQKLMKESEIARLSGTKVIEVSQTNFLNFSDDDIIRELITVAEKYIKEGNKNLIFFFDNFEKFMGSFWSEYSAILKNVTLAFKEDILIKFIISIDEDFIYNNEMEMREILCESLCFYIKQEEMADKIISTLKPRIKELMQYHKIAEIEDKALKMIYDVEMGKIFRNYLSYDVYLTYLDKIMSEFEYQKVTKLTFDHVCKSYMERDGSDEFIKISKDEKQIARHEAGHTLIALLLDFIYFEGVTIIGVSDKGYNGLTMIFLNSGTGWQNKKNCIKYISFYLAGRYAEGVNDRGAVSDLEKANSIAKAFVCTSGAYKQLGKDFFCKPEEYFNLSSEKKLIIERLVDKILKKAKKYAIKKLEKHKDFLDALTEKIYKEKYVSREDVLKLWSEFN